MHTCRAEFTESIRESAAAPRSLMRLSLKSSSASMLLLLSASASTAHSASASLLLLSTSLVRLQERVASARARAVQPASMMQLLERLTSVRIGLLCRSLPRACAPSLPKPLSARHRMRTEEFTCSLTTAVGTFELGGLGIQVNPGSGMCVSRACGTPLGLHRGPPCLCCRSHSGRDQENQAVDI